MKKLFLAIAVVFSLAMTANAQNNLGVRFYAADGTGAQLSWQHELGSNRLEFDLGWNSGDHFTAFDLTGIYQWTGEIGSGFGWYAGVGAYLGYRSWEENYTPEHDGKVWLALAGQVGIEYKFNAIPIQLSLDLCPKFFLIDHTDFHWGGLAFSIRYCF